MMRPLVESELAGHPVAQDMPHVAYVLLWYPVFTQPFIFREVEGLKKLGLPITVYSLYGCLLRECSAEMSATAGETHSFGLRSIGLFAAEFFRLLVRRPLRLLSLVRDILLHRRLSLESVVEACWGFLAGVYFARLFKESGIDLIHAPWPRGCGTAVWTASRLSGIPFSLAARGDDLEPAEPDLSHKLQESLFIRANNQSDQARMSRMLPPGQENKITLVYNSLTLQPPASVHLRAPERFGGGLPVRLLAVGRFSATKGFEYLMEACGLLKERGFPFRLTLVGGGGLAAGSGIGRQLTVMRDRLGLGAYVSMPGLISHNELPTLLAEHDIFTAPCVIAPGGQRDGIPNVIIEAMVFGLPVISTEVGAIPELVRNGESGITVPERNASAMADAVEQLSADPLSAQRLAENGRRLALEIFDGASNIRKLRTMFVERYAAYVCRSAF